MGRFCRICAQSRSNESFFNCRASKNVMICIISVPMVTAPVQQAAMTRAIPFPSNMIPIM